MSHALKCSLLACLPAACLQQAGRMSAVDACMLLLRRISRCRAPLIWAFIQASDLWHQPVRQSAPFERGADRANLAVPSARASERARLQTVPSPASL